MSIDPKRAQGSAPSQSKLDSYFDDQSAFWRDIYGGSDVYSLIHQHRLAVTLDWVDQLGLASDARVLEAGCGAGLASVALAQRGLRVHATDAVPAMVELTRQRARERGVEERLTAGLQDVQALAFEAGSFDVVIALGVIPWLSSPAQGVAEMARVLAPGGTLIANADNARRLNYTLDPLYGRWLAPARRAVKRGLVRAGARGLSDVGAQAGLLSLGEFNELLWSAGMEPVEGRTFGYGPFTFMGRQVLPDRAGVRLQLWLQALGERGRPRLKAVAAQYIVRARKPG